MPPTIRQSAIVVPEVGLEQDEDAEEADDEAERLHQLAHRARRRAPREQRARPHEHGDLRELGRLHADRPERGTSVGRR